MIQEKMMNLYILEDHLHLQEYLNMIITLNIMISIHLELVMHIMYNLIHIKLHMVMIKNILIILSTKWNKN